MALTLSGNIYWRIPDYLRTETQYDRQEIFRSSAEQTGYTCIDTINLYDASAIYIETYYDASATASQPWYLITLANSNTGTESRWFQAVRDLTPREARLVSQVRNYMPPIINKYVSDIVFQQSLLMGLAYFNNVSPITNYTLNDIPYELEMFIIYASMIAVVIGQFLPISIRDFSYSGVTPSITIDRSTKLKDTISLIESHYQKLVQPVKMDIGLYQAGTGLGTFALPLSLGSRLAPGLLNVFDVLKMGG